MEFFDLWNQSGVLPNAGLTCKDVWRGPGESQVRAKWLSQVQALVRLRVATPQMPQEPCGQGIQPIRMATRASPIPERLTQVVGRVRHRKMTDEPT